MKKDKGDRKRSGKSGAPSRSGADKRREKSSSKGGRGRGRGSVAEDRVLAERMAALGLSIREVPGDGNCMFRSIADQLGSSAADAHGTRAHEAVRAAVVAYMRRKRDLFAAFVEDDEGFDAYLDRMSEDGEWGGHQELYAAAELYGLRIVVHQAEGPRMVISCSSSSSASAAAKEEQQQQQGGKRRANKERSTRSIHLSYHGGSHYNSVRLVGDDGWGAALPVPSLEPSSAPGASAARPIDSEVERRRSSSSSPSFAAVNVEADEEAVLVSNDGATVDDGGIGGGAGGDIDGHEGDKGDAIATKLESLMINEDAQKEEPLSSAAHSDRGAQREARKAALAERRSVRAAGCLSKKEQRRLLRAAAQSVPSSSSCSQSSGSKQSNGAEDEGERGGEGGRSPLCAEEIYL